MNNEQKVSPPINTPLPIRLHIVPRERDAEEIADFVAQGFLPLWLGGITGKGVDGGLILRGWRRGWGVEG